MATFQKLKDAGVSHFTVHCTECGREQVYSAFVMQNSFKVRAQDDLKQIAARCRCDKCCSKAALIIPD